MWDSRSRQPHLGFVESASCDLPHRSPCLIDGLVCVGVSTSVGVSDGDAPVGLARYFAGSLSSLQPKRIEQRVVFVGVTVGPTIDRNGRDVACGIEAAGTQCARQLLADVAFHGLEAGGVKLHAARDVLLARRMSRAARGLHHVNNDGLVWGTRELISTHTHGSIEVRAGGVP